MKLKGKIVEVLPTHPIYQAFAEQRNEQQRVTDFLKEHFFPSESLVVYSPKSFGLPSDCPEYEVYAKYLEKKSRPDGVYLFKTTGDFYMNLQKAFQQVPKISALDTARSFGSMNLRGSQWVDNRLFVSVANYSEIVEKEGLAFNEMPTDVAL